MTITQTLEIPANRRITLEIPQEISTNKVVLTFTPSSEPDNPRYNDKAFTAIKEAEAMIKGEIPANWHKPDKLGEVWKELLEN